MGKMRLKVIHFSEVKTGLITRFKNAIQGIISCGILI
jgi:hypothetical protein